MGRCRCKRLTHYEEEVKGVKYCRSCKDGPKIAPDRLSCTFCTFNPEEEGVKLTCLSEPVGFLTSDDQERHDRFEFGPWCLGYSSSEVLFVIPTKEGWVELRQSNKINQPPTLKLNNRRPQTDEEKIDLSYSVDSFAYNSPFQRQDILLATDYYDEFFHDDGTPYGFTADRKLPYLSNPTSYNYD